MDVISNEIENFLKAKENRITFSEEEYNHKYNNLVSEQNIVENAYRFDEKVIALKNAYESSKKKFTIRTKELLLAYYNEYESFSEIIRNRIKTSDIIENLKMLHDEYFSYEAIEKRKIIKRNMIISYGLFIIIAIVSIVGGVLIYLNDYTFTNFSFPITIIILAAACIAFCAGLFFMMKNKWLFLGTCIFIIAVVAILILNRYNLEEAVTSIF